MPGKRGKQTVEKGIWHIGGRRTLKKENKKEAQSHLEFQHHSENLSWEKLQNQYSGKY